MPHKRLTPTVYLRDDKLVLKHSEVRQAAGNGEDDFQEKVRRAVARKPALRSYILGLPREIPTKRNLDDPRHYDVAWTEEAGDLFFRPASDDGVRSRLQAVFAAAKANPSLVRPWPERVTAAPSQPASEPQAANSAPPHDDPRDQEQEPEDVGGQQENPKESALTIPERFRRIHTICKATPGQIGGRECNVVDARDLYDGLEVTMEWAKWINRRVLENPEFEAGVDYETYNGLTTPDVARSKMARPRSTIEARLTLKTSRKVSMAERSPVGNLVRDYYCWTEGIVEEIIQQAPSQDGQLTPAVAAAIATAVAAAMQPFMTELRDYRKGPAADNTRPPDFGFNPPPSPVTTKKRGQTSLQPFAYNAKDWLKIRLPATQIMAILEDRFVGQHWAERGLPHGHSKGNLLATPEGYASGYVINYQATRPSDGSVFPMALNLTKEGAEYCIDLLRAEFGHGGSSGGDSRQSDFFRGGRDEEDV